jgi:hypothetical protein
MIRLVATLSFLTLPFVVLGQHVPVINPSRGMTVPSNAYRYGNILFPGGTPAPHLNSHAARMGPAVSGSIPYTGVAPGQVGRPGRPRTIVVPYAYPVFYGGGYGGGYYDEPQPSNVTVVVPQQPVPNVIINNTYAPPEPGKPSLKEYSQGELPETGLKVYEGAGSQTRREPPPANGRSVMDEKPTIHLIALKDGTVRQALGYWVKGEELHYVTPDSTVNHVSLTMLDRERSVQLNAERKLDFDLRLPR